jgi:hypothetical protein
MYDNELTTNSFPVFLPLYKEHEGNTEEENNGYVVFN